MLSFTHPDSRHLHDAGNLNPMRLGDRDAQQGRERLRHLIMGSPAGVRSTINTLHVLNYAEQGIWSQLITIPESGVVLTPAQGEVFSYLIRYRQIG